MSRTQTSPRREKVRAFRKPGLNVLLDKVEAFITRYVRLSSEHHAVVLSLWVAHAWLIDAADATPYIHVSSPDRESGKTRLLEVLQVLVPEPWLFTDATAATLFRKIDQDHPTILFDEVDNSIVSRDTRGAIIGALNAGYKRGATVPRIERVDGTSVVVNFDVFGPKVLSGIGHLPDTITSRAIPVRLLRRAPNEPVEKFKTKAVEPEAALIRQGFAATAEIAVPVLRELNIKSPTLDELGDRQAEIWEPLLDIAGLAGAQGKSQRQWAVSALMAAVVIHREARQRSPSDQSLLLAHVKDAFGDKDRIATEELMLSCWITTRDRGRNDGRGEGPSPSRPR